MSGKKNIIKLLKRALKAVEAEIESVREKPAHDVLFDGKRSDNHPPGVFYYEFESQNMSLRFAEMIRGEIDEYEKELELYPVEVGDKKVVLHFPHNFGDHLKKISLEWENDFVLKKLHNELSCLLDEGHEETFGRMLRLFYPDPSTHHKDIETRVLDDSRRNKAQHEALIKSLQNEVLYVWGPPGTGKTATLGFMMANYLMKGKRVLFASNTNRAVDVGLLSTMEALKGVEREHLEKEMTRFGEIALEHPKLEQVLFERQIKEREEQQKEKAAKLSNTLGKYHKLQQEIDNLLEYDEEVPQELDDEINLLSTRLDEYGGERAVEEKIERMLSINERVELERRQLVATTLAKVCTSELFNGQFFDAVVIDEASMANLPYLMVLAAKAKEHVVVVGDPMQLPPIALTNDAVSRHFLEADIFTFVSKSETTEDLFNWHDFNRPITTFFDVQYRLNRDLAEVLSSVFYEGRLKTIELDSQKKHGDGEQKNNSSTVHVVETQKYGPVIYQKDEGRGFSPVNDIHLFLIVKLVKRLVLKNHVPIEEIGIIVPFRNTVYDVRQQLYQEGYEHVEVGTIHTFQGREKRVIIFDTVMSGEDQYGRKRHYSVRPFDEEKNGLSVPRLLNVAFSRSKDSLVILADMDHIHKVYAGKFLGDLLDKFQDSGRINSKTE